MQKYLEAAGVQIQFGTCVTNVRFDIEGEKKTAKSIEYVKDGNKGEIALTENDLVFITNGSCTEGTIYGDQDHAPVGDAEVRTSGCWSLWKNIAAQDESFGHPEKFCSDIAKTNWESATVTTSDEKIISYIQKICKRDPRTGKVVTGGIVSCKDSSWLLSWTINRQGQFKAQKKDEICVWVYSLFTDVPGDYIKKPMKECNGKEITAEWLYHLGIPTEEIDDLAANHANCTPTMMPYITAFFMPRSAGDRPDVIPDGCVNAAFLGQFAETPRDTIFTTEYSVRTAMEAVYGLCGVDRGVPEVWGSVYDVRDLLDSTVKLMDGKSPLEMKLPLPLELLKKPLLRKIDKTYPHLQGPGFLIFYAIAFDSGFSMHRLHCFTNWPTTRALISVPSLTPFNLWKQISARIIARMVRVLSKPTFTFPNIKPVFLARARTNASAGSMITSAITSKLMPRDMMIHPMTR